MKNHFPKTFVLIGLLTISASSAIAQEYTSGHGALSIWDEAAQANMPQWIKFWLMFMTAVFLCGVLFIKSKAEARWLIGGVVLGLLFSKFIIPQLGIVKLSGLVALLHLVFWSPALYFLLKNRPFLQPLSPYVVWSGLATGCILFSFIFDIRDAFIYLNHIFF